MQPVQQPISLLSLGLEMQLHWNIGKHEVVSKFSTFIWEAIWWHRGGWE